jgi:hypothetical protein
MSKPFQSNPLIAQEKLKQGEEWGRVHRC